MFGVDNDVKESIKKRIAEEKLIINNDVMIQYKHIFCLFYKQDQEIFKKLSIFWQTYLLLDPNEMVYTPFEYAQVRVKTLSQIRTDLGLKNEDNISIYYKK
jgi:hypothetical protein